MENLSSIIKEHRFFKDLKPEHFEIIVGCASNTKFKAGDIILKEGETADHFYLISEGMVAIEVAADSHRSITIQTIHGGDILGWSWLIPPHRVRFNCRAIEDTQAIALDGKRLREKCEKNHDLGYELLKRLARVFTLRLEATRLQLLNIYDREVKEK